MPLYQVQISWTDGWRMERHQIEAETVEEACQTAIESAGESEDSWVSCEPGLTIVDDVQIVAGHHPLSIAVPAAFLEPKETWLPALHEVADLLSRVTREAGASLSVQTVTAVRDLLLRAHGARPDNGGMA